MVKRPVPTDTVDKQAAASRPDASAWVSANAGSGKTHVLTQRVIRLLLNGVPASRILCLTFTKAAAANMSLRVFDTLARWTALDDAELERAIRATGSAYDAGLALVARKLFSRTIETPGGLKIQTIHGFCESILHLFPFEANVPHGFEVIDEDQRSELIAQSREEAFRAAHDDPAMGESLARLARGASMDDFNALIDEALRQRGVIDSMRRAVADWPRGYAAALAPMFVLGPDETRDSIEMEIIDGFPRRDEINAITTLLEQGGATDKGLAERLRATLATDRDERLAACVDVFFSDGKRIGTKSRKLITKPIQKLDPSLLDRLEAEGDRIERLLDKLRAADTLDRSSALMTIIDRIASGYALLKRAGGQLDFEDLIERALILLTRNDARWVLYKLDSGIDHILVDEAQDTSDQQWRILDALAGEFTSGHGRPGPRRTFFAVGDEKQSIFSFQGAEPRLFDDSRRKFERRANDARMIFHDVKLNMSFRSAPGVLAAVDRVFALEANRVGLSSDSVATVHSAWKSDLPGMVEIWDPIGPAPDAETPDWLLPLDARHRDEPAVVLADRIGDLVARLLAPDSEERVHDDALGRARPVRAGDIMILLRRRGGLFNSLIRSLKQKGLPVAGADRMILKDHIAVMDLIALGRACLLPEDDLSLACALKSPLFGLGDDDLIAIAPLRKGSLHDALLASTDERHRSAATKFQHFRNLSRERAPFAFFSFVLDASGGRTAILARLGQEAGDAIDEFLRLALARERMEAPSLIRFLEHIESGDLEVKRDMEAAGDSIRVMTVHAAKGLEAKIVFMPDTCQVPSDRFDPKLFAISTDGEKTLLAWSGRKADDCAAIAQARARVRAERMNEYRRLLYVAMTRAEERLYIMGHHGSRGPADGCWHMMVFGALRDRLVEAPAFWNADARVWRLSDATYADEGGAPDASETTAAPDLSMPDWLTRPASVTIPAIRRIRPARPAASDASAEAAMALGQAMHALLQSLPRVARKDRPQAAEAILRSTPSIANAESARFIVPDALAVIDHPDLAPLFGSNARAEVPIAGTLRMDSGDLVEIGGRIDRLVEIDGEIWFADFKTGAAPGAAAPHVYMRQLALYGAALADAFPGRAIRAFLVWTRGPDIREFTVEDLAPFLTRA